MSLDCVFCGIAKSLIDVRENLLYEDDNVIIILDSDMVIKGHALVIWKEHAENISDLSKAELSYFSNLLHAAEKTLLELCSCDRAINLKTWFLVSHLHYHIYPVSKDSNWRDVHDMIEKDTSFRGKSFLYEYKPWEKEIFKTEFIGLKKNLKLNILP